MFTKWAVARKIFPLDFLLDSSNFVGCATHSKLLLSNDMKVCFVTIIFCAIIAACASDIDSLELSVNQAYEVIGTKNNTKVGTLIFNDNSRYVMTYTDYFNPNSNRGVENRVTKIIGSYKVIGNEISLNDEIVADVKFYNRWGEQIKQRKELFKVTSPGKNESLPFCWKAIVEGNSLYLY